MDDELEILLLSDISGDGQAIPYGSQKSSFITAFDESLSYEDRKRYNAELRRQQEELLNRSIIEKTSSTATRVPSVMRGTSSIIHTRAPSRQERDPQIGRRQTMPEKILQKRQIYLTQLFIDKKRAEIKKLSRNKIKTEERMIKETEKVNTETEEYKQSMNALQAELSQSRKKAAENSQHLSSLQKQLSQLQSNVNSKSAVISKNEEILDQYKEYEDFLKRFIPERSKVENVLDYYKTTDVLIEELDEMQSETLNLVNCYNHFMDAEVVMDEKLQRKLEQQKEEDEKIESIDDLATVKKEEFGKTKSIEKNKRKLDKKISRLKTLISETYVACFGIKADISPMNMLEKIEHEMEKMIKIEETVSVDILDSIKARKDEERRQKERIEGQEKRRLEQLEKIEKALERANKPIPRHDKKRPIQRLLPIKKKHQSISQEDRDRLELEQQESLLFS